MRRKQIRQKAFHPYGSTVFLTLARHTYGWLWWKTCSYHLEIHVSDEPEMTRSFSLGNNPELEYDKIASSWKGTRQDRNAHDFIHDTYPDVYERLREREIALYAKRIRMSFTEKQNAEFDRIRAEKKEKERKKLEEQAVKKGEMELKIFEMEQKNLAQEEKEEKKDLNPPGIEKGAKTPKEETSEKKEFGFFNVNFMDDVEIKSNEQKKADEKKLQIEMIKAKALKDADEAIQKLRQNEDSEVQRMKAWVKHMKEVLIPFWLKSPDKDIVTLGEQIKSQLELVKTLRKTDKKGHERAAGIIDKAVNRIFCIEAERGYRGGLNPPEEHGPVEVEKPKPTRKPRKPKTKKDGK